MSAGLMYTQKRTFETSWQSKPMAINIKCLRLSEGRNFGVDWKSGHTDKRDLPAKIVMAKNLAGS